MLAMYDICSFVILVSTLGADNVFAIQESLIHFHPLLICHGNQKHNSARSISAEQDGSSQREYPPLRIQRRRVSQLYIRYINVPKIYRPVYQKQSLYKSSVPLKNLKNFVANTVYSLFVNSPITICSSDLYAHFIPKQSNK